MKSSLHAVLFGFAAFLSSGCQDSTGVVVWVDVEPEVLDRAQSLHLRVCNFEGSLVLDQDIELADSGSIPQFPIGTLITPQGGDSSRRFWIVGEILPVEGYVMARQRLEGAFEKDLRLEREVSFDSSCWSVLSCTDEETCLDGECVDARVAPLSDGSVSMSVPDPCRSSPQLCPVEAVSAGASHSCGISRDGSLWCWGDNSVGQIGVEGAEVVSTPTVVSQGSRWAAVSAGDGYTCGVMSDGTLWCWGVSTSGNLGLGDSEVETYRSTPAQVGSWTDWYDVAAGSHTCGLRRNGELWCWGTNWCGEVGIEAFAHQEDGSCDNRDSRNPPETIRSPVFVGSGWAQVSVSPTEGPGHTCAIRLDGSLWCWGVNRHGELGVGDREAHTPIHLASIDQAVQVSAGEHFTCALTEEGSLWCWGRSSSGELGLETLGDDVLDPTRVGDIEIWSTLSCGRAHTCAVRGDSTLWCWGDGSSGQLGLGDRLPRSQPAQVSGPREWHHVSSSNEHSCARTVNGALACWGTSNEGALGTADVGNALSPSFLCGQ